ncbi:MAG: class II aldolase/adducin family protein [Desulfobacterales bacterium]
MGSALQDAGLNHTHSGNLSALDPADPSRFWITASGAPLGNLRPAELVRVRLSDLAVEGGGRPSSELATHGAVLRLPGAAACAHAHAFFGGLLGYGEDGRPPLLSPPRREGHRPSPGRWFDPPDLWGRRILGPVPVVSFRESFGSGEEMVAGVAHALAGSPLVLVAGHGPFCRGRSLADCLHRLCVFEQSAQIALLLARAGAPAAGALASVAPAALAPEPGEAPPRPVARPASGRLAAWAEALFALGLSAYGTGSMSVRLSAREIAWLPAAAAPPGWAIPRVRRPLEEEPAGLEGALHRLVHTQTPYRAVILAAAPHAITAAAGPDPEILPVDDEARHAGVRLLAARASAFLPDPEKSGLPRLLEEGGGCLLLEGVGVLGCGRNGLAEAALRVALAERVCRLRHEIALNHRLLGAPPPERFEKPFPGRR